MARGEVRKTVEKLEAWLARFDEESDHEAEEICNMTLPDYVTLLEESEFK